MRITEVIVSDAFAGTERYAIEVGTELARRGHDVTVVGGAPKSMQSLISPPVRWLPGATAPQALWSLSRGGRRDVVHSHITKADFVAAMAAPVTGGRRVSTRHITAPRGFSRPARVLATPLRAGLAHELAVSRFVADSVETTVDAVILNGVRSVAGESAKRGRTVLVANRLAPEKDTSTALRAWAAAGLGDAGWRLLIAGDGDQREMLEKLAVDLGIAASCEFLGWVANPDPLFRSAAMLLAPAAGEPCGLTILEAMAYGLPVVAAGSGGNLETVGQSSSAALFGPGDSAAAGALLRRLADSESSRDAYGSELQQLQRDRFTIEAHVDQLESIYAQALRRS